MNASPDLFDKLRDRLSGGDAIGVVHDGVIGGDTMIDGPFGTQRLVYADYVASGRALSQIEQLILDEVLPYYANSHTEASYCGAAMTKLRRRARAEIARLCGADERHAVIFTGSGATAGLNRLVHLLGIRQAIDDGRGATVITGPYEHHSNILPWRESGADVLEIPEAPDGGPDLPALKRALAAARGLVVGAFSAASNVSGITTDVVKITRMLKAAGALSVWDYAGGGPYLPIRMTPADGAPIDAIAFSPHKFVGGPGASGVLIVRKDAVASRRPTFPGGGSVRFVSSTAHDYSLDVAEREEAGTPNVIGDIRAALALTVKDVIGEEQIVVRDQALARRALAALKDEPRLHILGNTACDRLPILSFLIGDGPEGPIAPQYATRLLSDYFGIQARGGCACAGPYGHHLLGIDPATSDRIRADILTGVSDEKPGFIRLNLSYLTSDAEADRIIAAVKALPELADRYRQSYALDTASGTYVHVGDKQPPAAPPERDAPPVRTTAHRGWMPALLAGSARAFPSFMGSRSGARTR